MRFKQCGVYLAYIDQSVSLSVCLSVCLTICLYVHVWFPLSISLNIDVSTCPCLSSVCLFIYLSISISVCLSTRLVSPTYDLLIEKDGLYKLALLKFCQFAFRVCSLSYVPHFLSVTSVTLILIFVGQP